MHIFFTEDFTFMVNEFLYAPDDPGTPTVWIELHLHAIADENFDPVQTHFPREIREDELVIAYLYTKEGVGKSLVYDAFDNLGFRHICASKNSNKWSCRQGFSLLDGRLFYLHDNFRCVRRERALPEGLYAGMCFLDAWKALDNGLEGAFVAAYQGFLEGIGIDVPDDLSLSCEREIDRRRAPRYRYGLE